MKRCLLISVGKDTGKNIANQLKQAMGEDVEIDNFLIRNIESKRNEINTYDSILFSSYFTCKVSLQLVPVKIPYVIAGRVINHKNIKDIISIAAGEEVLLVNDTKESVDESIEQLINLGLDHITYNPYYPGIKNYKKCNIAITPGESNLIPNCVEYLVDIGIRLLDLKTVYKVKNTLGIKQHLNDGLIIPYIRDIIQITKSIDKSRRAEKEAKQMLEIFFDNVDKGIVYLNKFKQIIKINSTFESIIGKNKRNLLSKYLYDEIPSLDFSKGILESKIVTLLNREYIVDIEEIDNGEEVSYIIMIYPVEKIQKVKNDNMEYPSYKGLSRLHSLEDYLTVDKEMLKMIERARKFAKTDATIYIQGENGTGKEIIAQGMHRYSHRKNKPFVPVNIGAISKNLLESELFGYEEGSFTGARKEGKKGLFQVADGGTLFIDEIGDAPLDIQVKLLRVLQEKKIRRVGAIEEIPINVRVITATNKNLLELVDEGKFREDLYFRLNILPIRTIPLRMRDGDILHLLKHFITIYFEDKGVGDLLDYFTIKTLNYLKDYRWRGNVRQLINLVEYLSYIYEGEKFKIEDLPYYYLDEKSKMKRLSNNELWVLKKIYRNPHIGRVTLHKQAKNEEYNLGEGQIRKIINEFKEENLIKSNEKNRGLIVTELGIDILSINA